MLILAQKQNKQITITNMQNNVTAQLKIQDLQYGKPINQAKIREHLIYDTNKDDNSLIETFIETE